MIFLFPLDVGLALDPLFGADVVVVVVVVVNDLNTAPLLCAAVMWTFMNKKFLFA